MLQQPVWILQNGAGVVSTEIANDTVLVLIVNWEIVNDVGKSKIVIKKPLGSLKWVKIANDKK